MNRHAVSTNIKTLYSKLPLKVWVLIGVGLIAVVSYSLIFFIPKTIQFSYAEKTCVNQLVVAPDLQQFSSSEFDVSFGNTLKIGAATIASTQVCIEPTQAISKGEYAARVAPFGGVVASKPFAIKVPDAPVAKASDLVGKTISTAQPLKINLTTGDIINRYSLSIEDKQTDCKQVKATLSCDVSALDLAHGAEYTASLMQSYKEASKKVLEGKLSTLQPLVLTSSPIESGKVLYDAPESFSFAFDRPLKEADVQLSKVVGESTEKVKLDTSLEGSSVTVKFSKLDRESTYRLTLADAIGDNGSSLAAPANIDFTTSGGPKVASVSVGANSIARNATIIVTFDQPIDVGGDIAKLAQVAGVPGSVRKQSDTQLAFAIQGGDCTALNLVVEKGIKSASNGESSKEQWKFATRTICGSSWVIGSSVQGRSIAAYSFGSGASTILFTGGIHGSERSAQQTMQAWVAHLQAYGDIIPADKRVVIVPNTNPDGIAKGSRNNANNVNLGRNFPTANWSASIETTSGTLPTGGGTSAGSEPEASALIKLTRQLKPRLAISYHAQGRLVGANKFADSVAIGNIYSAATGYQTMFYNAEAVMGYAMTGEYEDWMGEEMNIPAILIELPSPSGSYLSSQMNALKKMLAV